MGNLLLVAHPQGESGVALERGPSIEMPQAREPVAPVVPIIEDTLCLLPTPC
ncbi:MAG: hypothetical protein M5U01_03685 [Ardenticatenaceae bacterium]|nr:hypothetical protein [Ardenticatenaceae bacterium]